MVTLNKIYTRTGDGGRTRLATGEDVPKDSLRVEAYGAVDEANSALGLAILAVEDEALRARLLRMQNDLFDVGADLATPGPDAALPFTPLRVTAEQVQKVEADIDALNADLSPLNSFVLPGGTEAAARLHLARATVRRAERRATSLAHAEPERVNLEALIYLNRLSDFLFVAARYVNAAGPGDVLWVPGASR